MRAAQIDRYGPPEVIAVREIPVPVPGPGEALVRVAAAGVNSGDARIRGARFPPGFGLLARLALGARRPRAAVPGLTFSGRVEQVGERTEGVAPGDEVAGMFAGAHAEYLVVPAAALTAKPVGVSHADAAGVLFGGTTALHFLRDRAQVRPGHTVLVNGASGAVGSSAVQLAVHYGAEVTAVSSAANHALLQRLGAHRLVDYRTNPVVSLGDRFDLVFDAVGNLTRAEGLDLLNPGGLLILAVAGLWDTMTARGQVLAGSAPERPADFATLLDLVSRGGLNPLVEVVGGLDALPEAHRRIDSGRKVGSLVILPQGA